MAAASAVRAILALGLLAGSPVAFSSEECITTRTQPNVRRHIEKLAQQTAGDAIDRSTFSYCGFSRDEYASIASVWRPQPDGSRLRQNVHCRRENVTSKKPWTCELEPEREMDLAVPGRNLTIVAQVDVELSVEFATRLALRAFEVAPNLRSVSACKNRATGPQHADEVARTFADPGTAQLFINQLEQQLLVGRGYTMIVFKPNTAARDGFELDCWYTYDEM